MPQSRAVIILPTYNEIQTIAEISSLCLRQQPEIPGIELNLLIVDGGSSDGTIECVSELSHNDPRVHLMIVGQRGLGLALLAAYEHATRELGATYLAQMDADLSHDPAYLPAMLAALVQGYDLSIGSRYVKGGGTVAWPMSRRLESLVANKYARLTSGFWHVKEWTSGYRAFTAELYHRLNLDSIRYDDYTLQPALVLETLRAGGKVHELPIIFVNRRWGNSKLPLFRYTFHLLKHFAGARLMPKRDAQPWPVRVPE